MPRKSKTLVFLLLLVPTSVLSAEALLLYAGKNHDEFIGCLNCGNFDDGSVCNTFGDYGSQFSDMSIWNNFGDYGSRFSDKSPWNKNASYPPVIVDKDGGFYGYFAANKLQDKRTEIQTLAYMLDNVELVLNDLEKAREWFCED